MLTPRRYDMVDVKNGEKDWSLNQYVAEFKSVAPAKMFICMTYEPEFLMPNNPANRTAYATPAECDKTLELTRHV